MLLPNRVALSIIRNTESPAAFVEMRVWMQTKDDGDPPDQLTIVLPASQAVIFARAIMAVSDAGHLASKGAHDAQFNDIMRMLDMNIPPLEGP